MSSEKPPFEEDSGVEVPQDVSAEDKHVAELLSHTIDISALATAVTKQKAADAADTLEDLDDVEAAEVIELMEDNAAAEALSEMEVPLAVTIIEDLVDDNRKEYAATLLATMAPDDAVSIVRGLDGEHVEPLFDCMPVASSRKLRQLCDYEEESAAGIMTTDFVSLEETLTITEVVEVLRLRELPENVKELPVTNTLDELVGVVSLRALLIGQSSATVAESMETKVAAVRSNTDREQVAREFDRYGYEMLPVIDASNRLLGIITVDDVIDIIEEEQTEDVQKTVGAGAGEAVYSGLSVKLRGRMPWLISSALMMLPATYVVLSFDWLIKELALLAVFMPLIAALAGNAGHQALAVTLRGIVLDEVRKDRIVPLMRRELLVGLFAGVTIGGFASLLLWVFGEEQPARLGVVFACAMIVSMGVGTFTGAAIPLIMRRLGADPAQASAIFLIMITDSVAFSTLLGFAYVASTWLQVQGS